MITKKELADKVAAIEGIASKKLAKEVVDTVFSEVVKALADGEEVKLFEFGSFKAVDKPERVGRNPATNEPMTIPAKSVVKFTPAKAFKDAVNTPKKGKGKKKK